MRERRRGLSRTVSMSRRAQRTALMDPKPSESADTDSLEDEKPTDASASSELSMHKERIENLLKTTPNVSPAIVDALIAAAPQHLHAELKTAISKSNADKSNTDDTDDESFDPFNLSEAETKPTPSQSTSTSSQEDSPSRKPRKAGGGWDFVKSRRAQLIKIAKEELVERDTADNKLLSDDSGDSDSSFGQMIRPTPQGAARSA